MYDVNESVNVCLWHNQVWLWSQKPHPFPLQTFSSCGAITRKLWGRGAKAASFAWIVNWTAAQRPIRRDMWPLFWTVNYAKLLWSRNKYEAENIQHWSSLLKETTAYSLHRAVYQLISTKVTGTNLECATISAVISKTLLFKGSRITRH